MHIFAYVEHNFHALPILHIFAYFVHVNAYECIGEMLMGSLNIFAYLCIFCAFLFIFKFAYNGIFILMHIPAYNAYLCI